MENTNSSNCKRCSHPLDPLGSFSSTCQNCGKIIIISPIIIFGLGCIWFYILLILTQGTGLKDNTIFITLIPGIILCVIGLLGIINSIYTKINYSKCVDNKNHNWNACKCDNCGKGRDFMHEWAGCKCLRCGNKRDEQHNWDGCICSNCRKIKTFREQGHDWDGCKCRKCGTIGELGHNWAGCKCSKCGKIRNEQHDWSKDCGKCSNCEEKRISQHDKLQCGEKCSKCGVEIQHSIGYNCKCMKCGEIVHKYIKTGTQLLPNYYGDYEEYPVYKCEKCGKQQGSSL